MRRRGENCADGADTAVFETADTAFLADGTNAVSADIGANRINTARTSIARFRDASITTPVSACGIAVVADLKTSINKAIAAIVSSDSFGFTGSIAPSARDAVIRRNAFDAVIQALVALFAKSAVNHIISAMINTGIGSAGAVRSATISLFDSGARITTFAIIANFVRRIPFVVPAVAGNARPDDRARGHASVA